MQPPNKPVLVHDEAAETIATREREFADKAAVLRDHLTHTLQTAREAVRTAHEVIQRSRARRMHRHPDGREPIDGAQRVMKRAVLDSERAITLRDQFVALVAHEMRQPLQAASAAAQLLEADVPSPTRSRAAVVLRRQIDRLSRLVEDLLESARVAAHGVELHMQQLDLRTLMDGVARDVQHRMDEQRHQFVVLAPREPAPFIGDAFRLHQVCVNLLENAARYTPPGGRIQFEGRPHQDTVELCVRDTGPGIPLDDQPHLFDIFVRGGLSGEGVGVGLAVVRELVSLHGGAISLNSRPGEGAEFVITLPIAGPAAAGETLASEAVSRPTV
jgi:signal transduction histidine kinase